MPRLFVAVWPPDEVLDAVAALPRPEVPGLRWTGREQWHVTLRFLGQVDDAGVVAAALGSLAGERPVGAGPLAGERPVGAGPLEAVAGPAVERFDRRVLHVPVAGLEPVAAAVVAATAAIGQPPDDRPFAGHITIARAIGRARPPLAALVGTPIAGRWPVDEVCLVASQLSSKGARYEVLDCFPCRFSLP